MLLVIMCLYAGNVKDKQLETKAFLNPNRNVVVLINLELLFIIVMNYFPTALYPINNIDLLSQK